ncbi:U3 small nucleolar RNA-associated protein MPP10 [Spathaspora sp. JA1]|nr:U3 small nucleolar RNA-associated protein MPP10 [Spathaspora sp. JA1]
MSDLLINLEKNPNEIFSIKDNNVFNQITKQLLDPITKKYSVLDEIYIDGLDSVQVFGQTKMVLDGVGRSLLDKIDDFKQEISDAEERDESEESEEEQEQFEDLEEVDEEEQDEEEEEEEQYEEEEEESEEEPEEVEDLNKEEPAIVKDSFGLNDGFFDIDEYNKQILALEDNEDNEDEDEEVNYFSSLSDESDEEVDYYDDFYDKPGQFKSVKPQDQEQPEEEETSDFAEKDYDNAVGSAMKDLFADEDEQEEPSEQLSSFEKQQRGIQAEIAKLEAELIADKKWTMKGEINSNQRPKDSLLEETELSFDRTAKPVPIITQEVTETIEDLIRKKIKNDEFNDLPKRIITDISKFHKFDKVEVSEQKSAKSLAEIYEDEYNQVDSQAQEISDEVKKQHDEITELFTSVNHKLDVLCSVHFVPAPHQFKTIDIKVTDASAPAISMEDAQPLHVSSEATLAPQEVYKLGDDPILANGTAGKSQVQLKSGLSYSKDEISRDDKQRLRRAAKRKKAKHYNERQEIKRQKSKQQTPAQQPKNARVGEVIDTLSKAKNITVIGKRGQMTDVKGNVKKNIEQNSNSFKL